MALIIRRTNTHIETVNIPFSDKTMASLHQLSRRGEISYIQADGDELDHIIARLPNLPYSYRICKWRGELATFIAENLTA